MNCHAKTWFASPSQGGSNLFCNKVRCHCPMQDPKCHEPYPMIVVYCITQLVCHCHGMFYDTPIYGRSMPISWSNMWRNGAPNSKKHSNDGLKKKNMPSCWGPKRSQHMIHMQDIVASHHVTHFDFGHFAREHQKGQQSWTGYIQRCIKRMNMKANPVQLLYALCIHICIYIYICVCVCVCVSICIH